MSLVRWKWKAASILGTIGALVVLDGAAANRTVHAAAPMQLLNRPMLVADPNRDPNWDWTQNVTYTLVTTTATYTNVGLPYYTNAGPASGALNIAGARDIRREDGWRLVLRDFGPAAEQPFFILYNRNRGILRVFYYHPDNLYSYAVGTLSFQEPTPEKSAALLTLTDSTDRYALSYDPARTAVAFGAMGNGWCYLDFPVTGYDPTLHLKIDPSFVINIAGIIETKVVLNGELNLTQRTATTQRKGSGGFNPTDISDIGAEGYKIYKHVAQSFKDVNDARETYQKMADADPKQRSAKWILDTIARVGSQKWISALGPVAGILQLVVGGGSGTQPAPLIFDGTVELAGEQTTKVPLYQITMRIPGAQHADPVDQTLNVLPLYDEPLGIFNVASAPRYNFYRNRTIVDWTKNSWSGTTVSAVTQPLVVEANLRVFGTVAASATHVIHDWRAGSYKPIGVFNTANVTNTYVATSFADPLFARFYDDAAAVKLAVKATLTPLDAVAGSEPITVIKTYTPPRTVKSSWPAPPFGASARVPARPSSLLAAPGAAEGIDLRWIDNAGNEAVFLLQELLAGNSVVDVATLPANTTSYHVPGGLSGSTRTFRIRASNATGSSAYSNDAAGIVR